MLYRYLVVFALLVMAILAQPGDKGAKGSDDPADSPTIDGTGPCPPHNPDCEPYDMTTQDPYPCPPHLAHLPDCEDLWDEQDFDTTIDCPPHIPDCIDWDEPDLTGEPEPGEKGSKGYDFNITGTDVIDEDTDHDDHDHHDHDHDDEDADSDAATDGAVVWYMGSTLAAVMGIVVTMF